MKNFINTEITAEDIAKIKGGYKTKSNQADVQAAYQSVLADTQTAVDNIEECLWNVNALRQIYIGFSNGDISFLDTVLGLNPRGANDSHYRDYLSLDEGSIIEIRVSGHPTTKNAVLDNANNKTQYLLQVVLIQSNTPMTGDAITTDVKVGNLQVLSQVYVGTDYNWDNLEDLLRKIAAYLTCPEYSDAGGGTSQQQTTIKQQENCSMNSRIVTLTESRLRVMIGEAVKGALNELDWKTYANAEKEARRRGEISYWRDKGEGDFGDWLHNATLQRERAKRFGDAAKDAFDRDYGYQRGERYYDDGYQRVGMGGDFGYTEEFGPHAAGWRPDGVADVKRFPHGVYTTEKTPEEFFGDNGDAIQAYNKAKDEIRDYKKGNYEYVKGKGWQLKQKNESLDRRIGRIVMESLRRHLR